MEEGQSDNEPPQEAKQTYTGRRRNADSLFVFSTLSHSDLKSEKHAVIEFDKAMPLSQGSRDPYFTSRHQCQCLKNNLFL